MVQKIKTSSRCFRWFIFNV